MGGADSTREQRDGPGVEEVGEVEEAEVVAEPAPADLGEPAGGGGGQSADEPPSVEDLLNALEAVTAERDQYLTLAQGKQAEFENFRKRVMKQQADDVARAAGSLVETLLPVLDAFDYGVGHGDESLVPMRGQLLSVLEKEGLSRIDPVGEPFDPNEQDAVAHEAGDGGEPVVAETLRAGYRWKGRLLRPAMVKVRD
jgi:molecular chaperone GrpE